MILSEQQLKQIIREEIQQMMLEEGWKDWARNAALAGSIASGVGAASPSYAADSPKEPAAMSQQASDTGATKTCSGDVCTISFKKSSNILELAEKMSQGDLNANKEFNAKYGPFAGGILEALMTASEDGTQGWEQVAMGDTTIQKLVKKSGGLDLNRVKEMADQGGSAPVFQAAKNVVSDLGL